MEQKHNDLNVAKMPVFVSNAKGRNVFTSIERELNKCNEFFMSVAFITKSGVTPFLQTLKDCEEQNIKGRILTTDYLLFSDPEALDVLDSLQNIELRMYETKKKGFHTKGYVFRNDDNYNIFIGSSNLTQNALFNNFEWNVQCSAKQDDEYVRNLQDEFKELWGASSLYSDCRERYKSSYKNRETIRQELKDNVKNLDLSKVPEAGTYAEIKPNKMQEAFISNLNELVDNDAKRALLVSATGTGKTYASALAIKSLMENHPEINKVLFLSHREQINKQAMDSYNKIFAGKYKMGLRSGNYNDIEEAKKCRFLFSTIQTMSKDIAYKRFNRDEYSIIIIDECHRAGAGSYQQVVDYFQPELFLGMSASPERMDGFNIFELFDYNIAYEIRLQQALENDLLCPFHYFGITDIVVNNEQRDYSDFNLLISNKRVDYIVSRAKYYGHAGTLTKGLVFCSRNDEAQKLCEKFNAMGIPSVDLSGVDSQEIRMNAIKCLESNDPDQHIDYIFTVDIFNEGVDIPQVNQVILLRPTQSPIIFVQQIGRGLRKYNNKDYVVILDFIGNYNNNYMIPIALSGDRTGNKDNMRRCLLEPNEILSGASTIHFDSISKKRIYEAIDSARMNTLGTLKEGYNYLKMKLNKIPSLMDFDDYGELDPMRIVQYSGSYHNFLLKYDDKYDINLTQVQSNMVEFISTKLMSGKRIQELLLLDILVNGNGKNPMKLWEQKLKSEYNITVDKFMRRTVLNVLNTTFYAVGSSGSQYGKYSFVDSDGNIDANFSALLNRSQPFKDMICELIRFGLHRNAENYDHAGEFMLYKKYTYEDVCRLLSWKTNINAQSIGGYKFDEETKTFPVFINYDKAEDINDSINYKDEFIDQQTFKAISKSKRTMKSPDVQHIKNYAEEGVDLRLFLRKNKDDKESKEFYYLGKIVPTGKFEQFIMDSGDSAVEIIYKLEVAVPDSLYDYIVAN